MNKYYKRRAKIKTAILIISAIILNIICWTGWLVRNSNSVFNPIFLILSVVLIIWAIIEIIKIRRM